MDGRSVRVPVGTTLMEAARLLGITVPSLCFSEGLPHHTSCMVCLVEDLGAGRLVPSCATPAEEGQKVRTGGERVLTARRRALELLLSEHAGDCEAPCVRACPAGADIPGMARRLGRGDWSGALAAMLVHLPLAGSLAMVCPAPCERACRRGHVDSRVAICSLKRAVAGAGLTGPAPYTPQPALSTGKSVAVVGAGPAGLSTAYFLALGGSRCIVIDERSAPGGMLRRALSPERLPGQVLDADVALLRRLGVELRLGEAVRPGRSMQEIRESHDALVLAVGSGERLVELLGQSAAIDPGSGATELPGVFAGGNAVRSAPMRMTVRGVAEGRKLARSVLHFLDGRHPSAVRQRFDSRRETLRPDDLAFLAREAALRAARSQAALQAARSWAARAQISRPAPEAAEVEASEVEARRCLDCGCSRRRTCSLRGLADDMQADGRRFPRDGAAPLERARGAGGLSLEPGKCIRCGICIRIAEKGGDRPGLAFTGRGTDARVSVPFGGDIGAALPATAAECVACCPTGALAWDR